MNVRDVSADVAGIPTPALVIDVAAMERNIRRMAGYFAAGPCRLRPHFKAHKTPEIARRQVAAGSCTGVTCATVSEAEVVADALADPCRDILIANEPVGPGKCERVATLARRVPITVAVDSTGRARRHRRRGQAGGCDRQRARGPRRRGRRDAAWRRAATP